MTLTEELKKAEELFHQNAYEKAANILLGIRKKSRELTPICNFLLAHISNNTGDPMTAYELYYQAFSDKPDLAANIYAAGKANHNYVFKRKRTEMELTACPLCGSSEITPKWCYLLCDEEAYNSFFNPVRLWMYCQPCHHIFARYFPENLFIYNDKPRSPNPQFFSYYSGILDRISQYTSGISLFEVGIGACECLLAAQEIGYDAFGIDVIDKHVQMARERFGLNAETFDFIEFQSDRKFDVIIMGDVLEHVSDPVAAIHKAYALLEDNGALWISTPNFDSAFSIAAGHHDSMKKQQYHLNYFSRHSLYMLLEKCGLTPVDYSISSHYNGSMEVIAVKTDRTQM